MDTWATSSLTPQIAGQAGEDQELFAKVFPMDVRPQAHDIIRTWLFSTILRSHLDYDELPWANASISGWVLDPDRKKMSKSKGNVVTPMHLLEQYGADAVRYWAANGRPGTDTAFDSQQMKVGRRLAVKLLNASKFALAELPAAGDRSEIGQLTHPLDRALMARLETVVGEATASFEDYDYARALERAESFFWWYCDFYLELVKGRRYDLDPNVSASVSRALRTLAIGIPAVVRPVPAVRVRRGVVVVAAGLDPSRGVARCRGAVPRAKPGSGHVSAGGRSARDHRRRAARGAQGQVTGQAADARPGEACARTRYG